PGYDRHQGHYREDPGYDARQGYPPDEPAYDPRRGHDREVPAPDQSYPGYREDPGYGYREDPRYGREPDPYDAAPGYGRGRSEPDAEQLQFFQDDPNPRGHRRNHGSEERGGRSAVTLLLTFAILAGLVFGGWYGFTKVRDFFTPPDFEGSGKGKVTVTVHTGDTAGAIGNELYRKGVVASGAAFVNAAEDDERSRNIQPGAYQLKKKMQARAALVALLDPKNKLVDRVTVPEGQSNVRVYKTLSEKLKIPVKEFTDLDKDPEAFGIDKSWFKRSDKKDAPKSLEGFLYPSTYEFGPDTTAAQAIQRMVDKFLEVAKELDLQNVAAQKDITPYEAVIVASLGEAEVIPKDLGKVSRVIYNRLNHEDAWMTRLQFDSTTNYWLEKQGKKRKDSSGLTRAELNDPDNPYSTHAHAGLPPGPIGNPSMQAMEAAVSPEKGDWLYFVAIKKDGSSAFASTLPEHDRNVELCKERKLGC
ncbi:MAG: endolytic transglycosylase MltG, partial [Micromonosporaceae bacterium]